MPDLSPSGPMLRNPLAETLAARSCGFDALSVDLEHSVIPESAAAQICLTAPQVGVTPLVRVSAHDAHYANRLRESTSYISARSTSATRSACRAGMATRRWRCFERLVAACGKHGKIAGVGGLGGTPEVMQKVLRLGVRFVTAGVEWDFLLAGARQRTSLLRGMSLL